MHVGTCACVELEWKEPDNTDATTKDHVWSAEGLNESKDNESARNSRVFGVYPSR